MTTLHSQYYVYVVRCSDDTYYTGKTHDLEHRIKQHNGLLVGGAKYTSNRRPVTLVYQEVFSNNKDACAREEAIKQLTRKEKQFLIAS